MFADTVLENYSAFKAAELTNRFIKHTQLQSIIQTLPKTFEVTLAGKSEEGRDLKLIKWGDGPIKVFLWSQMHGDEATGTMALFDLINYLQLPAFEDSIKLIQATCTLFLLPMVNPDGAARFLRRNSKQIDINRDYTKSVSVEAQLLKTLQKEIKPDFGFNLHDQSNLWSVKNTGNPATLSYLAPAADENLTLTDSRKNAMFVIADIFSAVNGYLPQQIGLFDETFESRAFGDNFQASGTATVLIEAGGLKGDEEKQEIRRYFFLSIVSGLISIASNSYIKQSLKNYDKIPANSKEIMHILVRHIVVDALEVSIGICFEEEPTQDGMGTIKTYLIKDIGDLDNIGAYYEFDGKKLRLQGELILYKNANFDLYNGKALVLSFKNGNLQTKL